MAKKTSNRHHISNRRARYDYDIKDSWVAGIQLSGIETMAIRKGEASLRGAYVTVKDGELWLINASIGSSQAQISETERIRSRKLLLKSREIDQIIDSKGRGMTIVPLEIINDRRYIKIRIATGVGKKLYDKRATLKARDANKKILRYSHRRT